MEFKFDVRSILMDDISKVDNSLIIKGWNSKTRFRVEYQQLYELINSIGEASAFSQSLSNVITTSEKLQNSDHLLYLMKEDDLMSQSSRVVGMLKIGRKKLFLLNAEKQTKEVAPICILDFYVHESRQRRGYGRRLFEYMLRDQGLLAGHLAIDKPSDKLLTFLMKHYSLNIQVPQTNNFVVYQVFFEDRPISDQELQLTTVNRSRGGSRTGSCANSRAGSRAGSRTGSRPVSPELPDSPNGTSPSTARKLSNANPSSPAGRPTYGPRHSSIYVTNGLQFATFHPVYSTTISPASNKFNYHNEQNRLHSNNYQADILHGRADRHTAAAVKNPRFQPTLDWMKNEGAGSEGGTPYYSRTPSNTGSPICRTPYANSPHGTPPKTSSIAPTPSVSPNRVASPVNGEKQTDKNEEKEEMKKEEETETVDGKENGEEGENGDEEEKDEVDKLAEELENSLGKTGNWRDNIARNSDGPIKHLSAHNSEGTSMGVLKDDESVYGHLKFHHHKLW